MAGKYFEELEVGMTFDHQPGRTVTETDNLLYVNSRVVDKRESRSRADRGIVTFEHQGINQRDELVCSCVRGAMMMKRPA
jgi:acyl dehydratase